MSLKAKELISFISYIGKYLQVAYLRVIYFLITLTMRHNGLFIDLPKHFLALNYLAMRKMKDAKLIKKEANSRSKTSYLSSTIVPR